MLIQSYGAVVSQVKKTNTTTMKTTAFLINQDNKISQSSGQKSINRLQPYNLNTLKLPCAIPLMWFNEP
jgi:hypothetical protein